MTDRADPDPQRLREAHQAAHEWYRSHLLDAPAALAYLRTRGIVAATAHSAPWGLGYAPPGWANLYKHLRGVGFSDDELLDAGLVTKARTGIIDVFRDRVMFPIRDSAGQVIAFTGRSLDQRNEPTYARMPPKYRNTTTTPIYQKSRALYGLAEQLGGDTQPAAVMLVEGPADVVAIARLRQSMSTEDYPDPYVAVAPCGTALTSRQVGLLSTAVPPGTALIVALDGDAAGRAAADKAYQLLRDWPGPVDGMQLPAGSDPASLVAAGPAAAMAAFRTMRRPLVDLILEHRIASHLQRHTDRVAELQALGRDPSTESLLIRIGALHHAAPLLAEVATANPQEMARLSAHLSVVLDLDPLSVFEAVYPPGDDLAAEPTEPFVASGEPDRVFAMEGAGFPDPQRIHHEYARTCPQESAAATWVQHDSRTGHTAWVLTHGAGDSAADRCAAQLAAEVAGRVAPAVGARQAVEIARAAVNAHFAQRGEVQGNASIAVLTTFDGDAPRWGAGRLTLATAGKVCAYAANGGWFAPLTEQHTLRDRFAGGEAAHRPGHPGLTASVRGGPIAVNRLDLPVTHILLAGPTLHHCGEARLSAALQGNRANRAIREVRRLGGPATVALVVRPRLGYGVTPAGLAAQERALGTTPTAQALSATPRRLALPPAPMTRRSRHQS